MAISKELKSKLLEERPGIAVLTALEVLLKKDEYLLSKDANERSITHRLGMYLQDEFATQGLDVDCEYNRTGIDPKRIRSSKTCTNNTDGNTVFPDIIVHVRGEINRNHLVIEVKKSTSQVKDEIDLAKLKAYKRDDRLKYEYGLFIVFTVGAQPGVDRIQWID